jgi:ParB family chromosome partitioning protein
MASHGRELSRPRSQASYPRSSAQAKGEQATQLIDHLKKAEMAKEAERLLDSSGWVPEPLRTIGTTPAKPTDSGAAQDVEALPAFLAEDQEENPEEEPDQPAAIAAE